MSCVDGRRLWTPTEDAYLREHMAADGAASVAAALDRTEQAIYKRSRRLGIYQNRPWTELDDAKLRMLWGFPLETVASDMGRTIEAVCSRAHFMGFGRGVPEGCESLTACARRTGFHVSSLRRIFKWAGVPLSLWLARGKRSRAGKWHKHYVEPVDADTAIARWMQAETPFAAGRRHGMSAASIVARLEASGLPLPYRHKRRSTHWRIPSETIDKAVAMMDWKGNQWVVRKEAA